jgi:tetratricopeptide (TPR) repeat protein
MAIIFNKNKALESAIKALNQGRVNDAIKEYQQILKADPKDQVTLMTLGDLFVRQGDTHQATLYFERLAQIFLGNGFNGKAIAIYKKIAKLAPNELEPLERLADLYVQQGVLSEARPVFLQIAEGHMKAGRAPKAVEILRRALEVEPDNPRLHARLADLLKATGQKAEAAKAHLVYAQRQMERGDFAEAQQSCDRALDADPDNVAATTLKAQVFGLSGQPEKGVDLLRGIKGAESGGSITTLLFDLLLQAGLYQDATELTRRIFAADSKLFSFPFRVANALHQAGQNREAFTVLRDLRNAMIEGGEEERYLESLIAISQAIPDDVPSHEEFVNFCRQTSNSFHLHNAMSQLATAYAAAGQFDKAEPILRELLEKKPGDARLTARLKQVQARETGPLPEGVDEGESATDKIEAPTPELDEETQLYVSQAMTDVDLFSSYGLTVKATNLLEAVLQRAPRFAPALERLLDISVGAANEKRTVELAGKLEEIYTRRGNRTAAERFGDLRRRFQKGGAAAAMAPASPAEVQAGGAQEFSVAVVPQTDSDEDSGPTPQPIEISSPHEEIDLSDEWHSSPAAPAASASAAGPAISEPEPAPAEDEAYELELVDTPAPSMVPNAAVPSNGAGGNAPNAPAAPMSVSDFLSDMSSELDEGGALDRAERDREAAKTPAPVASAAGNTAREAAEDHVPELDQLFQEFRTDMGELADEDEDLETHYNLGTAYREMGLLDEAIGEFQRVANAVQRGKPFRYAMQCSTMLGQTFLDKGEPQIAALWYARALELPGLKPDTILALRYDLGVAQALAGDSASALKSFRQVYAMNIDYRDVAERIATLQRH